MSATERGVADPLAEALRVVLDRRGGRYNLKGDELAWARQLRDVAQVCWMNAGEPGRLRSEDADRSEVCHELVHPRSKRARRLRLVPAGPAPVRAADSPTPRRRAVEWMPD